MIGRMRTGMVTGMMTRMRAGMGPALRHGIRRKEKTAREEQEEDDVFHIIGFND